MGVPAYDDLKRFSNRYKFTGNPEVGTCDPSTGCVLGPLTNGRWIIVGRIDCYWIRGDSTVAASDVLVDELTPSTSMPMVADTFIPIDVTGATDNYVAFKSKSGGDTGLVFAMQQSPEEGY